MQTKAGDMKAGVKPTVKLAMQHAALALCVASAWADSPVLGGSQILSMPTGRLEPDGNWRWEASYAKPYVSVTTEAAVLPWLQVGFGVTRIMGTPGFPSGTLFSANYGDYKDKTSRLRLKISDESQRLPALAFTINDPVGTGLFGSRALAATKQLGPLDLTLGYGTGRIGGVFAGVAADVSAVPGLRLMLEKDANRYETDKFASLTGLDKIKQPIAFGAHYQSGAWGMRVARKAGATELAGFVDLDAHTRLRIPKTQERERYRKIAVRPSAADWAANPDYQRRLVRELAAQGFSQLAVGFNGHTLQLTLAHSRYARMSEAVGAAAQAALWMSPLETREIAINTLSSATNLPFASYRFTDVQALYEYLTGQRTRDALSPSVGIRLASAAAAVPAAQEFEAAQALKEDPSINESKDQILDAAKLSLGQDSAGNFSLEWRDAMGDNDFRLTPKIGTYLNGPGALQYSLGLEAAYDRRFGPHTFGSVVLSRNLYENVTTLGIQPSDSTLPNVRSRGAFYQAGGVKLDRALVNHFVGLGTGLYGRVSAGIYERAFAGVGGQVLYLPGNQPWAADATVDAVAQRSETKPLGLNGYRNTTALGSLHYRLPAGVRITARAGRFLAGDTGVRFEAKRQFDSGIELGVWASYTDAKDLTGPVIGTGKAYRDKGITASIPLDFLLPVHTRARAQIALSPWARDVGQMVESPADLYALHEDDVANIESEDGLGRLAGVSDDTRRTKRSALSVMQSPSDTVWAAMLGSAALAREGQWARPVALGAGVVLASALLDKPLQRAAQRVGDKPLVKAGTSIGNALPVLGMGAAAWLAWDGSHWQRSAVARAGLEAGGSAVLAASALKYAINRARPSDGLGNAQFGGQGRANSSMPSRHTAVMFGVLTPFAQHFDAPWLYGLGALTAGARVAGQQHWASDAVAGSLIGYGLGSYFYGQRQAQPSANASTQPQLIISPQLVGVQMAFR
jgi:membrane-associated phospholipid phosphatase